MPIEFNCPHCQKVLKTADDKAGKRANCPGCGEPITVPVPQAVADEQGDEDYGEYDEGPPEAEYEDYAGGRSGGSTRVAGATKQCPMCGEQIKAAAVRCRFCGEDLDEPGSRRRDGIFTPTEIEPFHVISTSWDIFKSQMGLCIGGFMIVTVIGVVANVGLELVGQVIAAGLMQNGGLAAAGLAIAFVVGTVVPTLIQWFLQIGLSLFLLKIARGQPADLGDLFAVMRWKLTSTAVLRYIIGSTRIDVCLP